MSNRLGLSRRLSSRALAVRVLVLSAIALGAACGDDDANTGGTQPGNTATTAPGVTIPDIATTFPLDVPTTFIENCAQMPASAAISTIVGIPLDDGTVVATGSCAFRGLNEQNRVITLTLLTDPGDQASFNDVETSLGASTPLTDPTFVDAWIDPSSLVFIYANGAIYTVRTLITDAAPPDQVSLSVAVLHMWLGY